MSLVKSTKQSDLQSFGELEKYLYGGHDAFSFFNLDIKKCMPFVQSQIEITKQNGTANFGYTWSLVIDNNSGDYLQQSWLELEFPEIKLLPSNSFGENGRIRWTDNLMHNIIDECTLTFNDTVITKLDNFSLDFLSEFNVNSNFYKGYMKNIGNNKNCEPNKILSTQTLILNLPLFFTKDTGNSIPLAALPHTDIRINFKFKNWENLLILENTESVDVNPIIPKVGKDIEIIPFIKTAKVFGDFITVSDEERTKMTIKNKIMMIEQISTSPRQMVVNGENSTKIDLLFKQSVKSIYFAIRNTSFKNIWSNYDEGHSKFIGGVFDKNTKNNIIKSASIKYNDKVRVPEMSSHYFNYIVPLHHATKIPEKSGMYMYSYALNSGSDPSGGVNLSRIDNPSLHINITEEAINSTDKFELIVVAVSNNIIKISDGIVSFPVV